MGHKALMESSKQGTKLCCFSDVRWHCSAFCLSTLASSLLPVTDLQRSSQILSCFMDSSIFLDFYRQAFLAAAYFFVCFFLNVYPYGLETFAVIWSTGGACLQSVYEQGLPTPNIPLVCRAEDSLFHTVPRGMEVTLVGAACIFPTTEKMQDVGASSVVLVCVLCEGTTCCHIAVEEPHDKLYTLALLLTYLCWFSPPLLKGCWTLS